MHPGDPQTRSPIRSLWTDIVERFGEDVLDPPLFYKRGGVRFELSMMPSPGFDSRPSVAGFVQAVTRVESILGHCFPSGTIGVVSFDPDPHPQRPFRWPWARGSKPLSSDLEIIIDELRGCGIEIDTPDMLQRPTTMGLPEDAPDVAFRGYLAFSLERDALTAAAFGSLGRELGVSPAYRSELWIFDPARSIMAWIYDDRGMDLWGPNLDLVAEAADAFPDWVSDIDLERAGARNSDRR